MDDWLSILLSVVLIAYMMGWVERSIQYVIDWGLRSPIIVIRSESAQHEEARSTYHLFFSVLNRRRDKLALNTVLLELGDYSYGSTMPGMAWVAFQTFEHELSLEHVQCASGATFPALRSTKSPYSMGSFTYSLLPERGQLEPREGVDFDVLVNVIGPPSLKGKYPNLWALGGRIEISYDSRPGKERRICYPASRDKPF